MYYALFEDIQNVVEVSVTTSFQEYYKKMELFCNIKDYSPQTCLPAGRGAEIAEKKGEEIEEFRFNNDIQ